LPERIFVRLFSRIVICAVVICAGVTCLDASAADAVENGDSNAPKAPVYEWNYKGRVYKLSGSGQSAEPKAAPVMSTAPHKTIAPTSPAAPVPEASKPTGFDSGMVLIAGAIIAALIVLALAIGTPTRRVTSVAATAREPALNANGMVVETDHSGTGVITITRRHRKSTEIIVDEKVRERQAAMVAAQPADAQSASVPVDEDPFAEVSGSISERIVAKHSETVRRRSVSGE
jgi:hypothetical protein